MTRPGSTLRERRTQKLLRDALIELIEERGFEALTVSELTARAMVSRAAFYRRYQDKYDLVEQVFDEAMSALFAAVGELGLEHPTPGWVAFFEHIATYARLYGALLGRKGSPWFARKMCSALATLITEHAHPPHGPGILGHVDPDTFAADMVSALFVEAITWWLDRGMPYTPREIATRTSLLAAATFKEASTWR